MWVLTIAWTGFVYVAAPRGFRLKEAISESRATISVIFLPWNGLPNLKYRICLRLEAFHVIAQNYETISRSN